MSKNSSEQFIYRTYVVFVHCAEFFYNRQHTRKQASLLRPSFLFALLMRSLIDCLCCVFGKFALLTHHA